MGVVGAAARPAGNTVTRMPAKHTPNHAMPLSVARATSQTICNGHVHKQPSSCPSYSVGRRMLEAGRRKDTKCHEEQAAAARRFIRIISHERCFRQAIKWNRTRELRTKQRACARAHVCRRRRAAHARPPFTFSPECRTTRNGALGSSAYVAA